jgi:hypothetical protein
MPSLPDVDTAFRTELILVRPTLAALNPAIVIPDARFFFGTTYPNATLPYVTYYDFAAPLPNDRPREELVMMYTVEGVSDTRSVAKAIQQTIYARMHKTWFAVTGWSVYLCIVRDQRMLTEDLPEVGKHLYRAGLDFEIRLSVNTVGG